MVSLRTRIFRIIIRNYFNINPIVHPNLVETIKKINVKGLKDINKKGYKITRKETDNKTRYQIITKDTNKPAKKIIYYLHGGAYIAKLTNIYQTFTIPFCDLRDDIEVILLDYDVAPEYKYPTQLNQAYDLWKVLTKNYNPKDIIIGGDSSGGNLALSLILKIKNEENVSPKAGFFLSPWTDMTGTGKSYYTNYQKDVQMGEKNSPLTQEKFNILKDSEIFCFIGDANREDPYVSPIYGDYTDFIKSLFIVGSDEVLLDDTLEIVKKIKEKGSNNVELINQEGMFHTYPIFYKTNPESKEAYEKIKNFIIESFE
ncbi:alpha/beta-hydrolase [Anaeromyces robustus]|uniref:Alpha/beta-hydrolase n=1 Tax=Anaeromyces robustus TaxID=1754192 RepID=A0A1Y1X4M3_9FUNG|nr:alpha/beta-hydrolase [Anaeromyces robustus]|eukprot:ORX80733.1 alpha/beta-hydrolase [Anaeromyces robustus]